MKKTIIFRIAVLLACAGCGKGDAARPPEPFEGESAIAGTVKVAVVCNMEISHSTRLLLDGCVGEGRSMGFTVDTFTTDGDNERCAELLARIGAADYRGLVLLRGTRESLEVPVKAGLKIVAFDSLRGGVAEAPFPHDKGITDTKQDYAALARISLEKLVAAARKAEKPLRVIRVDPGARATEESKKVFDSFVHDGIIEEAACLNFASSAFARGSVRDSLAVTLTRFKPGTVDAVWAPGEELALGSIDALVMGGRWEIKLASIGVSDEVIRMMANNASIWVAAAAIDPKTAGIVNMRLLAAKLAGEDTPDGYVFGCGVLESSFLHNATSMSNIASAVPGWPGEQGLFDSYPWMANLKAAENGLLRITGDSGAY